MIRLAERLGYLWQRYVAWRDHDPSSESARACLVVSKLATINAGSE